MLNCINTDRAGPSLRRNVEGNMEQNSTDKGKVISQSKEVIDSLDDAGSSHMVPDGGWAWLVCLASAFCHGSLWTVNDHLRGKFKTGMDIS